MLMQNAKLILALRSAFQLLNLVRCPRLHTTTLAAIRQSGLEVFDFLISDVRSLTSFLGRPKALFRGADRPSAQLKPFRPCR